MVLVRWYRRGAVGTSSGARGMQLWEEAKGGQRRHMGGMKVNKDPSAPFLPFHGACSGVVGQLNEWVRRGQSVGSGQWAMVAKGESKQVTVRCGPADTWLPRLFDGIGREGGKLVGLVRLIPACLTLRIGREKERNLVSVLVFGFWLVGPARRGLSWLGRGWSSLGAFYWYDIHTYWTYFVSPLHGTVPAHELQVRWDEVRTRFPSDMHFPHLPDLRLESVFGKEGEERKRERRRYCR